MTDTNLPAGEQLAGQEQAKVTTVTQTPEQQADSDQGAERKRSKGGFQRREEKLKQERDMWRDEALKARSEKTPDVRKDESASKDAAPKLEDFDSYDEYIRADARFAAKQEAKEALAEEKKAQREQSLREAHDKQVGTHNERMEKHKEKLAALGKDFQELIDESESPFTLAMRDACVESELGPEVIEYLCENPERAQAMTQMGITALNREIGKIEASLTSTPEQNSGAQVPEKKVTKAPAPIKPVNSGSNKSGTEYRKDMTQKEFNAMREAQVAAKRGGGGR